MKHKIAIINSLGSHGSAFHFYLFGQAKGLINKGLDVYLYTNNKTTNPNIRGLNFFQFYRKLFDSKYKIFSGFRYIIGSTLSILHARIQGCQIIHYHIFYTNILVFFDFCLTKLLFGKVVTTIHDVNSFLDGFDSPMLTKWIYGMTDTIITHNQFSKNELKRKEYLKSKEINIIPHGNYLPFITPYDDPQYAREYLSLPKDRKILLFFGLIKKEKGLEVLLKALYHLKEKHPDILLVIAGKPWSNSFVPYQKIIDKYNLNDFCILHTKFILENNVKYYYASADIVVLPYTKIYQSGVLLMSLSYDKLTVVSDLAPLKDIITHHETGFVFKNNDEISLAETIDDIFSTQNYPQHIIENTKQMIRTKYDWDNIAGQTMSIYDSIIE
ncbi:MAG: glycosyltransferase family 4 protein [Bacteroidota bacterium]|nr:glycosyltransferase family 4 protein [Bacteroidota bacterium]